MNLDRRTRESVMDDNPWIYPLMARELVAEKRIGTRIEDPREFLYVEAGLDLENAAVSVKVGSDADGWKDSTRGRADLAVNRNGWVRIAVHAPARRVAQVGVPAPWQRPSQRRAALRDRVGTGLPPRPGLPAGREHDLARQGPAWRRPQRRSAVERSLTQQVPVAHQRIELAAIVVERDPEVSAPGHGEPLDLLVRVNWGCTSLSNRLLTVERTIKVADTGVAMSSAVSPSSVKV